jgi:hypothetical protein
MPSWDVSGLNLGHIIHYPDYRFCCFFQSLMTTGYQLTSNSHTPFMINFKLFRHYVIPAESHGSTVCIATGYGLDDRRVGVRVQIGLRIFSSPYRSDWLWVLSNGCRGRRLFPRGYSGRGVNLAIHLKLSAYVKKTWTYRSTLTYAFME